MTTKKRDARSIEMDRSMRGLTPWCAVMILVFLGGPAQAAITDLRVVGVTATQALVSYTAPDANPCKVEVSESASYSPLVHDVDPALFPGADQDNRSGNLVSSQKRIVLIGKRLVAKAQDGKNYSLALQASTDHFFRITCGSEHVEGTFKTANIPFGMTYQDIPQLDRANPGSTLVPTLINDRTQTIVDPHTGALIRRVSMPADTSASGPYMYFGGSTRICSNNLMGTPAIGYLCSFANGNGGYGMLYYIIPATGESRYLGYKPVAYPLINPNDGKFYTESGHDLVAETYTGSYAAAAPNTPASFSRTTVISNVSAKIHAFNNNFVAADFGCGVAQVFGDYAAYGCARGIQDTYGWIAVFRISTGNVIAAMQMYQNPHYRWTGMHHLDSVYDQAAVFITGHGLVGGNGIGGGPYVTSYTGSGTLPMGSTVLPVSGEPACAACGADPDVPLAQAGDSFTFGDTAETVTLVTKTSPTSWVITPTVHAHASNAVLTAAGNFKPAFWKFLQDPNGMDATGADVVQESELNGHIDMTTNLLLMEHWQLRIGDLIDQAGQPWTRTISESPSFAGAFAQCYGNGCASHPSAGGPGQPFLTDYLRWDGGSADQGKITPLSGQLYQFHSGYTAATPKQMAQAGDIGAFWIGNGPYGLLDVSGPGVSLGVGVEDSYKYCIANAAGECHSGSAKGDTFMNLPGSPALTCGMTGAPCFNNFDAYGNGVLQIGLSGTQSRVISGGLTGLGNMNSYPTAKSLADGSWLLFTIGDVQSHTPSHLVMAKLPPFEAPTVDLDRSTFLPLVLNLSAPPGVNAASIDNAVVQFGYEEQGDPEQYFCTSRREKCEAVSGTLVPSNPFYYQNTDAHSGQPCAGGACMITVPVLPMHTVHFQVIWRDSSNVPLWHSTGISAELSANIQGGGAVVKTVLLGVNFDAGSSTTSITWTTNNPTDAYVEYGVSSSFGQRTPSDFQLVTQHQVVLTNLVPNTQYYFRVHGQDTYGALVTGQGQFRTAAAGAPIPVNNALSRIQVYPNPWRSDRHAAHPLVTFAGLTVGTTIKIFTASAREVKELHTDGPSISWDLANDSGDKVASGIYMYLITDGQGDKAKGKIGIIK